MTSSGADASEGGRRRRHWSDEDKALIVAECDRPGASVSLVARRHDLNTNLLFSWRRRFRERQRGAGEISFVPAVIAPQGRSVSVQRTDAHGRHLPRPPAD
jgi:transposase